ncbi:hypothetical protein LCGC14_1279630 [marine sediment metagenome]|uniref:Uncharacterized protein n=1 Tax=marine sediment metagenome TaxID=412755 RepID=A0A0F9NCB7_9ZZZZ
MTKYFERRKDEEPTIKVEKEPGSADETVEKHPAYAQIGASRVSGGAYLYGSDFRHQHYITIQIHDSELRRQLSGDRAHADRRLIEIAMSEAQWATFVSSLNQGGGVQCTLEFTPEVGLVPSIAQPKDRKLQFSREMGERFDMAVQALKDLETQIDAVPLSDKKKEALKKQLRKAEMNLEPNMEFVAERFDEHMERTVERAKSEVNAYAQRTLGDLAQIALRGGEGSEPLLLETPAENEDETERTS